MTAETIVTALIDQQTNLANDLTSETNGLVSAAATAMYGQFTPNFTPTGLSSQSDVQYSPPGDPGVGTANITKPTFEGGLDDLGEIDTIELSDKPTAPTLDEGNPASVDKPSADINSFNREVPDIDTAFDDVVIPAIEEFDPLELIEISPTVRDINVDIPNFTAVTPQFLGKTPEWNELAIRQKNVGNEKLDELIAEGDAACQVFMSKHYPEYDNQVASMDAHLLNVMNGNATAWSDTTEQKLYDLSRARAEQQNNRVQFENRRNRGNQGAVGELAHKTLTQRAEQDAVNAAAMGAYEVQEKRADRELQHLQFVLSAIQSLRSLAQQTWLSYNQFLLSQNQFALSYAESCIRTYVEAHNLAIQRYNADLGVFQAEAAAWEVRIRNALIEYEIAKMELDYELAKVQVNRAKIDELNARISVNDQKIRLAATRIQAIAQQLENRKLPLEIFRAEIDAHKIYLEGRRTEIDIYRALIDGEKAITDNDMARVRNYATQVDAWRTESQTKIEENRHRIERNRYLIDVFRAWIEKFRMELDYEKSDAQIDLQSQGLKLDEYRALMANAQTEADVAMKNHEINYRGQYEYDRMRADYVIAQMGHFQEKLNQIGQVSVAGAKVLSDLAAGIMVANGSNVSLINETTQTG